MRLGKKQIEYIRKIVKKGGKINRDEAMRLAYEVYEIRSPNFDVNRHRAKEKIATMCKKGALIVGHDRKELFVSNEVIKLVEEVPVDKQLEVFLNGA